MLGLELRQADWKLLRYCFLTLWEILLRRLYFVRQSNARNLQVVVPFISPGGINYELHSVGFRAAFARDRSRPDVQEHRRRPIRQETKNATEEEEVASIRRKRKSIISWVRLPRSIKLVKFRGENNGRDSPVRRHRVSVPRAVLSVHGGHRRRHRGRFRGQKGDPLTASLSLFNIPVISASRRATRECCLCTHPLPQSSPRRAWDCSYAFLQRQVRCWRRITLSSLSPSTHRGHTYAFMRVNRGLKDNRARWVNYYRVATSFVSAPRGEVMCIYHWHTAHSRRNARRIVYVRICGTAPTKDLRKKPQVWTPSCYKIESRWTLTEQKTNGTSKNVLHRTKER